MKRIESGKSKKIIDSVRDGNKDDKLNLPIVCWSGEFSKRSDEDLFEHSGLIVLDFDHIDVESSKKVLATDQYVYACWVSPSGDGMKVLVKITNPERHRDHFRALVSYFKKQYALEVDESGVNESRACFESYDPNIIINIESVKFGAFYSERSEQQVANSGGEYTDYMKLNLATKMIRQSEDGEKHSILLKASRLVGGYISAGRMEEEEAVRILLREISKRDIDSEEHALKTIREGVEKGKADPIRDTIANEQKAKMDILINDGDMSFISSDDEDFRWIEDYANGKITVGLDTGDKKLDDFFRYKKEFMIINGHSNVGKTTLAIYMMVNSAVRHGWKWVVYSSENRTASIKMKLMQFAVNKSASSMTYEQRKLAYEGVKKHFVIISNKQVYSYTDLVVFFQKIALQQEVDAFFVDPYNSLKIETSSNINSHEYHYEASSEFLTLTNTHDVAVWLNMHAVTEAQRRKGDDGLPVAPYAEDTEGGGKFVNRSDSFVTIHRKIQSPNNEVKKTSEWHQRKVRETETGGQPTPIDEPIEFTMSTSGTSFYVKHSGKNLFEPIGNQFETYREFNIPINSSFLEE